MGWGNEMLSNHFSFTHIVRVFVCIFHQAMDLLLI